MGNFLSKTERSSTGDDQAAKKFTNIYVKNLDDTLDDKGLEEMFKKFGEITSAKVSKITSKKDAKSLVFGFVNFKNPDDAANVIQTHLLNNS